MQGRTQHTFTRKNDRFSPLDVDNKDPKFDYSFQKRQAIEDGGGVTYTGWEPVNHNNYNNETWGGPKILKHRQGAKQFILQDTILCKRPKEVSEYFHAEENEKRNHQIRFIRSIAKNARQKLRELDPGSVVVDKSEGFTQRTGPTEKEEE